MLFILVGLAYANSLDGIWTLDDNPNILQNPRLHIKDLSSETLYKTIFSDQHLDRDGRPGLNRPVARLTLALNWYAGQSSPIGYRLINILIHGLTALVLFSVVRGLFKTPNMRGKHPEEEQAVALLAALLWALNPIQTQAVVYIVQRMASLACFFYLFAIWSYLQARVSGSLRRRLLFHSLTLMSFLAGLGTKENVILLPAALILLEFTFFQDWSRAETQRRARLVLAAGFTTLLVVVAGLAAHGGWSSLLGYGGRLFSPWERLLTEPRILVFYLSQILYPVPTRLSIVHDVQLSRSFFEPWTTLPAIFFIIAVIGFAFLQLRKRPMISFAILFFFLNHVMESSIIGLELVFEHRNYLPSLFLFVPIAMGIQGVLAHYRSRRSGLQYVIWGFVVLWIGGLIAGTHIRNMAWSDAKTFWEDAAQKAPLSLRPVANLAYEYYERKGDYRKACELYLKALELNDYNAQSFSLLHVNIACLYKFAGAFSKASQHVENALALTPDFEQAQHLQSIVLYGTGDLPRAYSVISSLVSRRPDAFEYSYTLAQIALKMGKTEEAMSRLRHCMKLSPRSVRALTMVGIVMNITGDDRRAQWFLKRAIELDPKDKRAVLWMIDCKLKKGDETAAAEYASKFFEEVPVGKIEDWINLSLDEGFMPRHSRQYLSYWIWSQVGAGPLGMLKEPDLQPELSVSLKDRD